MEKLAVKVPEGQKEKLQEIAEDEGYSNRSELMRELIRNYLNERELVSRETMEKIRRRERQIEEEEVDIEDLKSHEEFSNQLG